MGALDVMLKMCREARRSRRRKAATFGAAASPGDARVDAFSSRILWETALVVGGPFRGLEVPNEEASPRATGLARDDN